MIVIIGTYSYNCYLYTFFFDESQMYFFNIAQSIMIDGIEKKPKSG